MTQTSEKWIEEFDEKINKHYFVLPDSHLNVVGIRSFVREAIANREKEIAEEVNRLPRYERSIFRLNADDVMGEGVRPMLLEEAILQILNHK